ncbi:hypothetical protein HHL26_03350 [Sphingobium sp. TB-6]|uniref:hypothetical protein n=1 Tax=Sphingobium sp. TB-6 TaxID=2728850 RepID=UPI00146AB38B|nr:hypothetical protein [Sphingobium sp. TB-6]NML88107.1 hypothetical protein [Sphingobium sp. TB-6]
MSRANPFGDLDDFAAPPAARPVEAKAIDQLAQASGFPSRKAQAAPTTKGSETMPSASSARQPRRYTTVAIARSTSRRPRIRSANSIAWRTI